MKIKTLTIIATLATVLQLAPNSLAAKGSGERWEQRHAQQLANLTPAEKQKLQAAHRQAMHDPSVRSAHVKMREARKEFRDAMHTSMLKADPTIQPILDKVPKHQRGERGGDEG